MNRLDQFESHLLLGVGLGGLLQLHILPAFYACYAVDGVDPQTVQFLVFGAFLHHCVQLELLGVGTVVDHVDVFLFFHANFVCFLLVKWSEGFVHDSLVGQWSVFIVSDVGQFVAGSRGIQALLRPVVDHFSLGR